MKNKSDWLYAFILAMPMVLFFIGYLFNHDASILPTGFIQYDNVSYIAYARQYLDADLFRLAYNNPFNDSANYAAIYFQPHILFFAFLLKLGIAPGAILIPFTLLCTIACFRLLIAIYDHLFPINKYRTISIWLFAWGGGLLAIAGFLAGLVHPGIDSIFYLDPGAGWWGLNFGRSLFFSCEAYYHLLFLSVIYFVLKQRWKGALLLSFILSISHPFTGIELLCILTAWAFTDRIIFKNKIIPYWYIGGTLLLLVLHLIYYLYYLNQFEDHRSVNDQYELNWRLRYFNMVPAYILVGAIVLLNWWKSPAGSFLKSTHQRLFLAWFIVALALANHELFMKPMQPLHFTRGYIWTALLLMGIPGLHYLFDQFRTPGRKNILIAALLLFFFSDNILWIFHQAGFKATASSTSYITQEQKEVFSIVNSHANNTTLLVATEPELAYLATVYTSAYPWVSHPFTTPFVAQKTSSLLRFSASGQPDPSWTGRNVLFILRKDANRPIALPFPFTKWGETKNYFILGERMP
jgi:hypothetical protein